MALFIGNIFSLLAAICIGVSVIKKNKIDLIGWQVFDVLFCVLSSFVLASYAAATTNTVALIRNVLAYKNRLTKNLTWVLTLLCVIVGLWANNRGVIGLLPIIASGSYTVLMYITKDEQQMRWALVSNLILWLVHDAYIQSYPLAVMDFVLSVWTAMHIYKNRNMVRREGENA